jgi:hypothetical protein
MFRQWWKFLHQILYNTLTTTEISTQSYLCLYIYIYIYIYTHTHISMYTKEPHIIYKRLKTISLTVSTVILPLIQKHCANGFYFQLQVARKSLLSHLVHLNSVYIFRSCFYHIIFNNVLPLCPGLSNGLLLQALQTKIFYSFLPPTSTTW